VQPESTVKGVEEGEKVAEEVDQIRRSSIAAHLPEAKRLLLNHPLLKDQIDFEA